MTDVYVVMATYFNGEGDAKRAVRVFKSEVKANKFADDHNAARKSAYDDEYEVETIQMED